MLSWSIDQVKRLRTIRPNSVDVESRR
jgi:hypothetical protein